MDRSLEESLRPGGSISCAIVERVRPFCPESVQNPVRRAIGGQLSRSHAFDKGPKVIVRLLPIAPRPPGSSLSSVTYSAFLLSRTGSRTRSLRLSDPRYLSELLLQNPRVCRHAFRLGPAPAAAKAAGLSEAPCSSGSRILISELNTTTRAVLEKGRPSVVAPREA